MLGNLEQEFTVRRGISGAQFELVSMRYHLQGRGDTVRNETIMMGRTRDNPEEPEPPRKTLRLMGLKPEPTGHEATAPPTALTYDSPLFPPYMDRCKDLKIMRLETENQEWYHSVKGFVLSSCSVC